MQAATTLGIFMLLRPRLRQLAAALVLVALAALATVVRAQPALDALIFRIFLRDGSTLVSYGDFARVADRVVLSIPLGSIDGPSPPLHLVSIAEAAVDWERTDRYSEAIRARHYAATQGEVDFEALSADVAKALNDVATLSAPSERLAVVTAARRRLADWPAAHHGYRASDVAQLATLLDDAIADLRVAAGLSRVDLTLVATAAPLAPDVPELPAPSERESFDQALAAASAAADTSERVSLLEAIAFSLGGRDSGAAGAALERQPGPVVVVDARQGVGGALVGNEDRSGLSHARRAHDWTRGRAGPPGGCCRHRVAAARRARGGRQAGT